MQETIDSSPIAEKVSQAWNRVLQHANFGPDDEFYDVGGNSMLLIAMLELLTRDTGKAVDLEQLVEGVSVNRLARLLQ